MPKQQLSGPLDEQLATVYEVVQQRLEEGKYSGAVHYAKEIIKVDPNFRDIQEILRQAKRKQRQQSILLSASLAGAILAVIVTRSLGLTQDWLSLTFAVLGGGLGFIAADLILRDDGQ